MKKLRLIILLLAFIATSCISEKESKGKAFLVVNQSKGSIVRLIQPSVIGDPSTISTANDSDDQHVFNLEIDQPTFYLLLTPNRLNLLLQPGDSLTIELNEDDPAFIGAGAQTNEQIFQFDQLLFEDVKTNGDLMQEMNTLSPEDYLKLVESRYDSLYPKDDGHLTDWAHTYQKSTLSYLKAFKLQQYLLSRDDQSSHVLKARISSFFPLEKEVLFFPGYLKQWSSMSTFLEVILPLQEMDIYEPTGTQIISGILNFEQDTPLRQVMLASALEQALSTFELEIYKDFETEINQILNVPDLKQPIDELLTSAEEKAQSGDDLLADAFIGEYDINEVLDDVLTDNQGKVIYLDIWATWCRPCIEEFKISKTFKANFEVDEVAYVYVCAQSKNQNAWKGLINKYELSGTHLYLNDEQFEIFTQRFHVGYFPSYYIIDQQGNTVNEQANLSPSNPLTKKKILELL